MDVLAFGLTNPRSDHFPIQVMILEDRAPMKAPFKLELMWFQDILFIPMIKFWWESAPFFT